MKTPKQARARQLADTIVTAATRVFKNTDFVKASTNRIAEVAGVSIGSLYQYFPNKDALVGVIIEKRVRQQLEELEALLGASAAVPCEQLIRQIIGLIARDSLAQRTFMRTLYQRGVSLELAPAVLEARERACRLIGDFLRKHHAPLLAPRPDPGLSLFCVLNGVLGAIFAAVLSAEREISPEELIDELSAMAVGHLLRS
ncbi:MAG: TetR/AcrR family transcriptional regulator [Oligoflexia bacterium]|nr:TetR/AcrR family transcriptional regulator [Oligoflexia bacterium]